MANINEIETRLQTARQLAAHIGREEPEATAGVVEHIIECQTAMLAQLRILTEAALQSNDRDVADCRPSVAVTALREFLLIGK